MSAGLFPQKYSFSTTTTKSEFSCLRSGYYENDIIHFFLNFKWVIDMFCFVQEMTKFYLLTKYLDKSAK